MYYKGWIETALDLKNIIGTLDGRIHISKFNATGDFDNILNYFRRDANVGSLVAANSRLSSKRMAIGWRRGKV